MVKDELTHDIIGAAIRVHAALGPGLLESAYRGCLHEELILSGFRVDVEKPISIVYRGRSVDVGYRIDLLVENRALIELKAVTKLMPIHEAQLLSYLRLGGYPVGLPRTSASRRDPENGQHDASLCSRRKRRSPG